MGNDNNPNSDFGGTGVGWPADAGVAEEPTKGPNEFSKVAPDTPWVDTENPTDDPNVFAELARQMSPGIG